MNAVVDKPSPTMRAMETGDLKAVVALETRTYPYPWTAGIFRDCLRVGYHSRVMEIDRRMAGYGILSVGAGEAHVLNLCIEPGLRRQGLGRLMLYDLMSLARERGVTSVFLEVRPSNQVALRLYESEGFRRVGVRKAYYQAGQGREDAIVLVREMSA